MLKFLNYCIRFLNFDKIKQLLKSDVYYFSPENQDSMKAIILKGFGGVENLVITDLPVPDISDNEVLIKVRAIGINPVDIKTRKGRGLAGSLKDQVPIILGWDISGIITQNRK